MVLARGAAEAQRREALQLLAENDKDRVDPAADQRARARILSLREATRAEAIRLFETSHLIRPLPAEERRVLAHLYRQAGERSKAREHLARLAAGRTQTADHVAEYIDVLVEDKDLTEATRWLAVLERLEPLAPRIAKLKRGMAQLSSSLD